MRLAGLFLTHVLLAGLATGTPAAAQDRPWMGVAVSDGGAGQPVRILRVFPGSPAERMGLQAGDALAAVDGRPIRTSQDLVDYVRSRPAGAPITIDGRRDDRAFRAASALGTLPDQYSPPRPERSPSVAAPQPGWVEAVREAFGRQREQMNRFQARLAEVAAAGGAGAETDISWLRHETEAVREQAIRLENLLRSLEPRVQDSPPAEFDPHRLILRGGAELGDSIQVLLSDPDTGRQFLVRQGDVVHGYTVAGILRTAQGLLLIRLQKGEDAVELVEAGL